MYVFSRLQEHLYTSFAPMVYPIINCKSLYSTASTSTSQPYKIVNLTCFRGLYSTAPTSTSQPNKNLEYVYLCVFLIIFSGEKQMENSLQIHATGSHTSQHLVIYRIYHGLHILRNYRSSWY